MASSSVTAYSVPVTSVQRDNFLSSNGGISTSTPSHQMSANTTYRPGSTGTDTPSRNTSTSNSNSPGNSKSRSFSISDILSDEVGSRKRPSNIPLPESRRKNSKTDHEMMTSPEATTNTPNKIFSPVHSGGVPTMLSPVNMYSALQQQMKGVSDWSPNEQHRVIGQLPYHRGQGAYSVPYTATIPSPLSSSIVSSPLVTYPSSYQPMSTYSTQLAAVAQMQQHYLQMQAAAAQQRQIMAANQQRQDVNGSVDVLANSRYYKSKQDCRDMTGIDSGNSENNNENLTTHQMTAMPILFKNNRKALKSTNSNVSMVATTVSKSTPEEARYHYKTQYSRSPLKPPNTTFSPSIFLTRPPTSISSVSHTPTNINNYSPDSGTDSEREVGQTMANVFMTSTPIRKGEKATFVTPNTHSPISTTEKREQISMEFHRSQQHHTEAWSLDGGTDSEVPLLRRPRVPRKRIKSVRPPSSSVTENTNPSMRHTPSHPPLSTLLTCYTASGPPGGGIQLNYSSSINDSGFISDNNTSHKALPLPPMGVAQDIATSTGPPPTTTHLNQLNMSGDSVFKTPIKSLYTGRQQGNGKYPDAWGSSPFTDHLKKTGRIQSVPPWFVCSDKRSDGKRLRLKAAINKSLMSTPSHSTANQLPAEWQKVAYGQTDDQKDLTLKARSFLRCRPRVLQFEKSV